MATMNQVKMERLITEKPQVTGYPAGGKLFDLSVALLSVWLLAGLYLDGFAHHHIPDLIETFFTPWHGVLYSGLFASALFLGFHQWRNVNRGYAWMRALPQGYLYSLLGVAIFMAAGAGDFLWHTAFGFEVGLEALVSPTHLALAVGGILLVGGPIRAAQRRFGLNAAFGWAELLPVVLSLTTLLSILTFFTSHFTIIAYPHFMIFEPRGGDTFFNDVQALSGVFIPSALISGILLYAIRQWKLLLGTFTIIIVGNGLLMTWFHLKDVALYPQVLIAVFAAGITADVLYRFLKPDVTRIVTLRVFAFTVPAVMFGVFFLTLITTTGVWWTIHLWAGSVFLAGVVGLLMSYLVASPVRREFVAD